MGTPTVPRREHERRDGTVIEWPGRVGLVELIPPSENGRAFVYNCRHLEA